MSRPNHAVMPYQKDIVLTVDYHKKNLEIRWLNRATGEERTFRRPTTRQDIQAVVREADRGRIGGHNTYLLA